MLQSVFSLQSIFLPPNGYCGPGFRGMQALVPSVSQYNPAPWSQSESSSQPANSCPESQELRPLVLQKNPFLHSSLLSQGSPISPGEQELKPLVWQMPEAHS